MITIGLERENIFSSKLFFRQKLFSSKLFFRQNESFIIKIKFWSENSLFEIHLKDSQLNSTET